MEFDGFDWDAGNREKRQKHGLTIAGVESLFVGSVVIPPDRENPAGERRYRAIGTTADGRKAFAVFTWRDQAKARWLRPIGARYMHAKEVAAYEKACPGV